MTTTMEKFAGTRRGNYCTLPTKDVEILPDVDLCQGCDGLILYVPHPKGPGYGFGHWVHAVDSPAGEHHVSPKTRCTYRHSHDAVYRQHAWHHAVECPRCGGVHGYGIGD